MNKDDSDVKKGKKSMKNIAYESFQRSRGVLDWQPVKEDVVPMAVWIWCQLLISEGTR